MVSTVALALYGVLLALAVVFVWLKPVGAFYLWIVGLAAHNAVLAAFYGAGVHGGALTAIQAWKEILLGVALARVGFDTLRARRLPFSIHPVDVLALAFGLVVCVYAVLPQSWLGGSADASAVGLALKHDLIPVGVYFLGRAAFVRRDELVRIAWTVVGVAAAMAAIGLLDVFLVPIGWWRDSAVVDYFHRQLGYDYKGTGGLPENFIYNTGSEVHFLRRLVSLFLSPLASAYMFVLALILLAALRPRLRLLVPVSVLTAAALLFTFSRSSLIALSAGLVVLGFAVRRWWPVAAAAATIALSIGWVHAFPHVASQGNWTKQDLVEQRNIAKARPGASGSGGSIDEPSIKSHLTSLREGARTVIHHPQGFGLGNAGQTASRTGTQIKAGESNYTEIGAETGLLGSLLWTAWGLTLLAALVVTARRTRWWASVGLASAFAATLVLAVQTDVIGDPWMAYCLWGLAGLTLAAAPAPLAEEHRVESPLPVTVDDAAAGEVVRG